MPYTPFDPTLPDAAADDGTDFAQHTRDNLLALRDGFMSGFLSGYEPCKVVGTGTAEQPQYLLWKKGTEWLRATITWGTVGGEDGNPTVLLFEYSSNSGGAYTPLLPYDTLTISYDADGNPSGDPFGVWS